MSIEKTGRIIGMHIKCDQAGEPESYHYQLEEKIPLEDILSLRHSGEDTKEEVTKNYYKETAHYLSHWSAISPLPGVTDDTLKERPLKVQYQMSGSKFKHRLVDPSLTDIRNIYVDKIQPLEEQD